MAFQAMMSGAECSTSNGALGQFMKHTQDDRSLQQDRVGAPRLGTPGASFRSGPQAPMGAGLTQTGPSGMDIFAQARPDMAGPAFDFGHMKDNLDQIRLSGGTPQGGAPADLEAAFRASQAHVVAGQGPAPQLAMPLGWQEQFQQSRAAPFHGGGSAQAQQRPMGMGGMPMGMMGGRGMMGRPMMSSALRSGGLGQAAAQQPAVAEDQRFTELSDEKWEAEFAKLDDQVNEEDKSKGKGKAKEDEAPQLTKDFKLSDEDIEQQLLKELDKLESESHQDSKEASDRFESLWNSMNEHAAQQGPATSDAELAEWEANLLKSNDLDDDILGVNPGAKFFDMPHDEEAFLSNIGTMDANGRPRLGEYRMQSANPFLTHPDPLAEGLKLLADGGSLSDATLLFEAATQRSVEGGTGGEADEVSREARERSEAWRRLGEAHAMNEMEVPAIRALEKAIEIDENNIEAYIPLAVSYTNEGYDMPAWETLKRYINKAYPNLQAKPSTTDALGPDPWGALNETTDLFLQAARDGAAKGIVDPEVQVGLGVLFFSNQSYTQAKDCFQSALGVRPNDFLLWNRLGAVLANSGNSEEAISAYQRALELRPTFTRAIYNLSVSCMWLFACLFPSMAYLTLFFFFTLLCRPQLGCTPRSGRASVSSYFASTQHDHSAGAARGGVVRVPQPRRYSRESEPLVNSSSHFRRHGACGPGQQGTHWHLVGRVQVPRL